jgi:acyl-CoA synthetase (NDP forming)
MKALCQSHDKAIIGFTYQNPEMPIIDNLMASGIPIIPTPERGVRAMTALVQYGRMVRKIGTTD